MSDEMKLVPNIELVKNKERVGNGVFFNNEPTKKSYADVVRTQEMNMKVVNKDEKHEEKGRNLEYSVK